MATGAAQLKSMILTVSKLANPWRKQCNLLLLVSLPLMGCIYPLHLPLIPLVPPVAPVNISVKEIGATWVYLQWFNPNGGVGDFPHSSNIVTVQEVGVQEVGGEEEKRVFDSNEEEANVTHLLPGTLYIFSVVAISVFGDLQATSLSSNTFNSTTTITGNNSLLLVSISNISLL